MSMPGGFVLDELHVRTEIANAGKSAVGLKSVGKPEDQIAYEEWVFPHPDDDRFQEAMADKMYSCGLNARRCLYAARVKAPQLGAPYSKHVGMVVTWLEQIARDMNAFVPLMTSDQVRKAPALDYGDILVVDPPTHVIVITDKDVLPDGSVIYTTSEGGVPAYGPTKDGKSMEHGMQIVSRRIMVKPVESGRLQTFQVQDDGSLKPGRCAIWAINARWLITDEGKEAA